MVILYNEIDDGVYNITDRINFYCQLWKWICDLPTCKYFDDDNKDENDYEMKWFLECNRNVNSIYSSSIKKGISLKIGKESDNISFFH